MLSVETVSLEFHGIRGDSLLWWLLAGIAVMLLAYGVFRLLRGHTRDGVICLSAIVPPVAGAALLADAAVRSARGDAEGAKSSMIGGIAICTASLLVGLVYFLTGGFGFAVWMVVVALEVAVAVGVFYAAVYAYLGTRRMASLMAMRSAAVIALLLILFKPAISVTPDTDAFRVYLPILLDRSASMETADKSSAASRYDQAIHMLTTQDKRIRRAFKPIWVHFATDAHAVDSLSDLGAIRPRGEGTDATNLAKAIRYAATIDDRRNLAGALLLSDGIHNTADNLKDAVIEAGVPIYTVGLGSANESQTGRRNIQLLTADAPFQAIKNNVTTITVRVRAVGFKNIAGEIRLFEEGNDKPVATAPLWTDKNITVVKKQLKWTPRDLPGTASAPASAPADGAAPGKRAEVRKLRIVVPTSPDEVVTDDNETELHILVTEPHIRVLYVEGSIRPEYKFLRRAMNIDQNVQLISLIRVQKARFSSYGTINGQRLLDLPRSDADFRMFDVIVLGDLDSTFLTRDQITKFGMFVKNGGGLMMIGGHNSFGPGGYAGTDIEAVLPVFVGNRSQPQETTPFVPMLTVFGQSNPIFEGIGKYFFGPGGREPTEKVVSLPELRGCVTVVRPKAGASVLALHPSRKNSNGPLIVLAVQPVGAGRSAAIAADTTWRWYMPLRGLGVKSPYRLFWGQMVRWLANVKTKATTATPSVLVRLGRAYVQTGQSIKVLAHVQNAKGQPADDARVSVLFEPVTPNEEIDPETIPMSAKRSGGMFETNLRPQAEGKYRVRVTALDSTGTQLGTDELILTAAPQSEEMDRLARDPVTLQMIATHSGARYADVTGLPELIDQIIERHKVTAGTAPSPESFHLYNFTLLFLLFVALLTGEWLLRRSWQLQ